MLHDSLHAWLRAGHFIGVFLWVAGLVAVYWLLRFHAHAPREAHEKLTLMERSLALMMDLSATLAIGTGLASAIRHDLFTTKPAGWLHIKLTIVVLGVLSVHGMLRARIKKFQQNKVSPAPQWQWSLLLGSLVAILVVVTVVKYKMQRAAFDRAATTAPAPAPVTPPTP
ncbi:MAG: CopD family protein [Deltaproteobacteria bacterium]|nr:CopD family protein [Deltaproteobacteria bacterium]